MNLHQDTLALARKFKAEADRLDTIFTQTCDPRALEGGAYCHEANEHRELSRKLFEIARHMEIYGV